MSKIFRLKIVDKQSEKEIEDYQRAMQSCRCNDQPVEKCDTCPNKEQSNG